MNITNKLSPLALAVCAVIGFSVVAPSFAQEVGSTSMREQRAKRMKELGKEKDDAKQKQEDAQNLWPNATRKSPEAEAKGKNLKALQDIQSQYEKQDYANVIANADKVANASDASAYEKSFAYQLAGAAANEMQDDAKAADYFSKAIAADGLDNNNHYTAMYNLAAIQYTLGKKPEALTTLDRFLNETKADKPEYQQLRAQLLADTGRGDEAAKTFEAQLAKNPNDKTALLNAVASYQAAGEDEKATKLLEDGYNRGLLTEEKELRVLYSNYLNAERFKDAEKVITEGAAKGILKTGPDLAKAYSLLGQNAYYNGSDMDAIALYKRAASIAADGEASLNLAKILEGQGKIAEAKAAAQAAIDKGVKKPEDAKRILAK